MIKKSKNSIAIGLSIFIYVILTIFKLASEHISSLFQNVLVTILSFAVICYLLWHIFYLKNTDKEKYKNDLKLKMYRLFYNFMMVTSINLVIPIFNSLCSRIFHIHLSESITITLYQFILLASVLFLYVSMINIGMKIAGIKWYFLIIIIILIMIIGFFDPQWWTVMPLLTTIILYYSSEDVYFNLSNGKDSGKNIQKSIKLNWNNNKEFIFSGSLYLYLSLVMGSLIKKTPIFLKINDKIFKNSNLNLSIESIFTLGTIRIVIFTLLFVVGTIGLYFLREKTSYFQAYKDGIAANKRKQRSVLKYRSYKNRKY